MNNFVFDDEFSPWEMALSRLSQGSVLSAGRFIALMEQDNSVELEEAALELEQRGVMLDVSDLPRLPASGKTETRLALEEKLYKENSIIQNLEKNDPLRLMLREMKKMEPIADEQTLAEKAAKGSQSAMERLTQGYLPVVYELAGEYIGQGVLLMDLMQEGSLGLWQSVLCYEGGSFREHSRWWIRQAMARAVTLQAHANGVGSHMVKAMERYRKADRDLLARLGRNPGEEEIALEMGVTPEEATAVGKMLREVEAMERVNQENAPKEEDPEDEQAVEDTALFQSRQRIGEMLSVLTEQESEILSMRFGLDGKPPLTAAETGAKLGLTADEVTQLETAALAKLRQNG